MREVWVVEAKVVPEGEWRFVSLSYDASEVAPYEKADPEFWRVAHYLPAPDPEPKADDGLRERCKVCVSDIVAPGSFSDADVDRLEQFVISEIGRAKR